jgi:glyoxylase-like metal-dependent hydrolase (beta-lactamase superfamily II)
MEIKGFFDTRTYTITYVVFDEATRDAVIIDPVLDYDPVGSKIWTESVDVVLDFVKGKELNLHYILETHAHADHLSGAQKIKELYPNAKLGVGAKITKVQEVFKDVFDLPTDFPTDGRQFDLLLEDGQVMEAGSLSFKTIFTPGHTPACATYQFDDAIFTGDAMFMPDQGTGRCDFPAGSAEDLFESITQKIYTLPDTTRVFVGHDYQPGGRELKFETTVAAQKEANIQLPASRSREDFVRFRSERDAKLNEPKLLFQSVQVNVDAGKLPEPSDNEMRYLKIPLNVFRPEGEGELELNKV